MGQAHPDCRRVQWIHTDPCPKRETIHSLGSASGSTVQEGWLGWGCLLFKAEHKNSLLDPISHVPFPKSRQDSPEARTLT